MEAHRPPPPPPPPPFSQQPNTIVIQNRAPFFGKLFTAAGWFGLLAALSYAAWQHGQYSDYFQTPDQIQERYHSLVKHGYRADPDKVAIIDVSGLIMEGDGFVKRQIDRVRNDDRVKAVVLRIDTPGGTVTGSDYILHHLNRLREEKNIPIVVSMGSIATSGGYYIAMAVGHEENVIFAEPTTTTGSIGVIIPHYDVSGLMERFDVRDDSIASGPRKQMLSMTRKITDENRELLQKYVDIAFSRFKDIVKDGRPEFLDNPEKLDELATGEIFSAETALENGLVDEIGFIEAAITRAIDLANLVESNVRVVRYKKNPSFFAQLSAAQQGAHSMSDLGRMLEMTAPKAYYITTWLPPILSSYQSN